MDVFLIAASLSAIGVYINNSPKNPRKINLRTSISENEIPSQDDIYNSSTVKKSFDYVQDKMNKRFELAKDPVKSNIVYSDLTLYKSFDKSIQPSQFKGQSFIPNTDQLDRKITGVPKNIPPPGNKGILRGVEGTELSLLTGKPLDRNHNNMMPFFSGTAKQDMSIVSRNNIEKFSPNDTIRPHKMEAENFFKPVKEEWWNDNGSLIRDDSRLQTNNYSANGVNPFQQKRDTQLYADQVRLYPKQIEDLDVNSRNSYKNTSNHGQREISLQYMDKLDRNLPDIFYENGDMNVGKVGNRTKPTSKKAIDRTKNPVLVNNYTGHSAGYLKKKEQINYEPLNVKKLGVTSNTLGIVSGVESFVVKDHRDSYNIAKTYKELVEDNTYQSNVTDINKAMFINHDNDMRVTNKQFNIIKNYKGNAIPDVKDGGYDKLNFDLPILNKDINMYNRHGIARKEIPSDELRDINVAHVDKQDLMIENYLTGTMGYIKEEKTDAIHKKKSKQVFLRSAGAERSNMIITKDEIGIPRKEKIRPVNEYVVPDTYMEAGVLREEYKNARVQNKKIGLDDRIFSDSVFLNNQLNNNPLSSKTKIN